MGDGCPAGKWLKWDSVTIVFPYRVICIQNYSKALHQMTQALVCGTPIFAPLLIFPSGKPAEVGVTAQEVSWFWTVMVLLAPILSLNLFNSEIHSLPVFLSHMSVMFIFRNFQILVHKNCLFSMCAVCPTTPKVLDVVHCPLQLICARAEATAKTSGNLAAQFGQTFCRVVPSCQTFRNPRQR